MNVQSALERYRWLSRVSKLGESRVEIEYRRTFSKMETEKLRAGFWPQDMDDRWVVYLGDTSLDLWRSWTGLCVYSLPARFEGPYANVGPLFVVSEPGEYEPGNRTDEVAFFEEIVANAMSRIVLPTLDQSVGVSSVGRAVLDENAIVELACQRLRGLGCTIISRCTTSDRGVDVVAENRANGMTFLVEAKGGTSSKSGSARYGKPFTHSQIFDRVAKGIFTCLQLRCTKADHNEILVVLAVPEEERFRSYLNPVTPVLERAGIEIWYLDS